MKIICERCFDEYPKEETSEFKELNCILCIPCEYEYKMKLSDFKISFMNQPERSKREDIEDLGHDEDHVVKSKMMRCSEHYGDIVRPAEKIGPPRDNAMNWINVENESLPKDGRTYLGLWKDLRLWKDHSCLPSISKGQFCLFSWDDEINRFWIQMLPGKFKSDITVDPEIDGRFSHWCKLIYPVDIEQFMLDLC